MAEVAILIPRQIRAIGRERELRAFDNACHPGLTRGGLWNAVTLTEELAEDK